MNENLGAALQRAVALYPDREAVVCGEERWTYAAFAERVAAFDAYLDDLGLQQGDVVAVLTLNCAEHLLTWFAVPRSGRVLNALNTRLAAAELEFIVQDCGARVLLVDDAFLEVGEQLLAACPSLEHLVHAGPAATPANAVAFADAVARESRPASGVDPDATAGIFYTGGTTGLPKGAVLSHRNLVSNAKHLLIALGYTQEDCYLHAAPMFHLADGASTFALTWVGGRHVVMPTFDPAGWPALIAQENVTLALLVPTMINMVVNHPQVHEHDLSSLRLMLYGASPMPGEVLTRGMEILACDWAQAYGMTEASPLATLLSPEDHRRGARGEAPYAERLRSAGRPVVGVEIGTHREDGTIADTGEPGEIWIRGANIMHGYWNRPQETAAALDDDGWYHSGDAGFLDGDGYLFVVDRIKDMIISGGENVYSVEVENAIYSHPAVLECAVFGVPDERWGERVHAAVVFRPGADATAEEIIDHCRSLIAGYKLPRSVDVHDEPLPKSGAGKLLKRDLRAPFWEGAARQVS